MLLAAFFCLSFFKQSRFKFLTSRFCSQDGIDFKFLSVPLASLVDFKLKFSIHKLTSINRWLLANIRTDSLTFPETSLSIRKFLMTSNRANLKLQAQKAEYNVLSTLEHLMRSVSKTSYSCLLEPFRWQIALEMALETRYRIYFFDLFQRAPIKGFRSKDSIQKLPLCPKMRRSLRGTPSKK